MHRYLSEGYIVWDVRNGNVIPAIGEGDDPDECVYSKSAAEKLAETLNEQLHRNTMPVFRGISVKVQGPFYARPVSMRKKLEGRAFGK